VRGGGRGGGGGGGGGVFSMEVVVKAIIYSRNGIYIAYQSMGVSNTTTTTTIGTAYQTFVMCLYDSPPSPFIELSYRQISIATGVLSGIKLMNVDAL